MSDKKTVAPAILYIRLEEYEKLLKIFEKGFHTFEITFREDNLKAVINELKYLIEQMEK